MRLRIAVCHTAADALAARTYWTGAPHSFAEVQAPISNTLYTDVTAEEWSGWPAAAGGAAGAHVMLPAMVISAYTLLFQK